MRRFWPWFLIGGVACAGCAYTQTAIGREKRDYVWIMARQPTMPEADYQRVIDLLGREGYDIRKIQKVPQRWERVAGPETRQ